MLDIYTVTFIGHRYIDRFSFVEEKVEKLVRELISSKAYVDFLVGRDGDFDQIVSSTVLRVKKRVFDANSSLIWVMPYETAEYRDNVESFEEYYDEVELCQDSASAHFKGAIQKRNRYMVDRANLLICYVENESGGAYQTMQYALKAGKKVINIYDMFDVNTVQRIAFEAGYYELVNYLEEHRKEYVHFIFTGEA